jgi:hypothetical protein
VIARTAHLALSQRGQSILLRRPLSQGQVGYKGIYSAFWIGVEVCAHRHKLHQTTLEGHELRHLTYAARAELPHSLLVLEDTWLIQMQLKRLEVAQALEAEAAVMVCLQDGRLFSPCKLKTSQVVVSATALVSTGASMKQAYLHIASHCRTITSPLCSS